MLVRVGADPACLLDGLVVSKSTLRCWAACLVPFGSLNSDAADSKTPGPVMSRPRREINPKRPPPRRRPPSAGPSRLDIEECWPHSRRLPIVRPIAIITSVIDAPASFEANWPHYHDFDSFPTYLQVRQYPVEDKQ